MSDVPAGFDADLDRVMRELAVSHDTALRIASEISRFVDRKKSDSACCIIAALVLIINDGLRQDPASQFARDIGDTLVMIGAKYAGKSRIVGTTH